MVKSFIMLMGLVAIGLMPACSSDQAVSAAGAVPAMAAQPTAKTQPAVSAQSAAKAQSNDTYQASGPLVVENQVDVAAQREGVVARIFADVGTRVHRGQLLAQLDDRQLTAERDAAKAKADGEQADYQHWKAELQMRETDLWRSEEMYKASLITAKQLDHDRYAVEGGKFYLQRQVQDLKNAQAGLEAAEFELDKTRILAPFDGVVARRYVREGQKVALNEKLFWVSATAPLNVKFTLPQELAGKVKVGDAVQVSPAFERQAAHPAKITLVSPVVDPASGMFELQAQVAGDPRDLRPGMTVTVNVKPQ